MDILIAEDDPIAAKLLIRALEREGHHIVASPDNGLKALGCLRRNRCDVVISDWEMPEMNGVELCQAVRTVDLGSYIYFILLTSKESTAHMVEGLSAGADDFITKPFKPEELAVRLRTAERVLSLETRAVTIFAMAKLAESRDPETGAHLERVRSYAHTLAIDLASTGKFADQITPSFVRLMYETSPLHDIGKVAIPDFILLKPGRLDEHEFELMKIHTTEGAATLQAALDQYPGAEFLRMARDVAMHHHEQSDGKGYPDGLVGAEIPFAARVFSVADVYDALRSKRVYKEAFGHDIAKNIIIEGNGTQFDSDVIAAFLRCEEQFREIAEELRAEPHPRTPELVAG